MMQSKAKVNEGESPKEIESKKEVTVMKIQNPHALFKGHHYYGPKKITQKEFKAFTGDYLTKFFFQCDKLGEFLAEGWGHWKPTIDEIIGHMYDHYPEQKKRVELCEVLEEVEESFGTEITKEMLNDCMKVCLGNPN